MAILHLFIRWLDLLRILKHWLASFIPPSLSRGWYHWKSKHQLKNENKVNEGQQEDRACSAGPLNK